MLLYEMMTYLLSHSDKGREVAFEVILTSGSITRVEKGGELCYLMVELT